MSNLTKNQLRRQRLKEKRRTQAEIANVQESSATETVSKPPNDGTVHPDTKTLSKEKIIKIAELMWADVKEQAKNNKEYIKMKDKDKLDFFRSKLGHAEFMTEYPIVARYMICYGQYSSKAFARMLDKMVMTKHPDVRPAGYMEDQWIRRQSDYVQYLWEAYQTRHHNTAERQYIWQESYKRLKGEFDDFKNMHKEVEEKIKHEKKELAAKNARELLNRIGEKTQSLSAEDTIYLMDELQRLAYKKMFSNCMKELLVTREVAPHKCSGKGTGPDQPAPKITMIETVDVERMNEIDDKYKPAELRGMEPVLEEDLNEVVDIIDETVE
jgi:hypothetical protein